MGKLALRRQEAGGIWRIARNRQFENDGSPVSTAVKGVKRAMADEYSREFSAKVLNGQSPLIELGFRQGGPAGYGWSFAPYGQAAISRLWPEPIRKSVTRRRLC
jgi:hypothetical protein